MISTLRRKLRERRHRIARPPLANLLRWLTAGTLAPYAGQTLDAKLVRTLEDEVAAALASLADAGALQFFGIHDSAELGDPPVRLYTVSDGLPPFGRMGLELEPVVAWIVAGGVRSAGWTSPGRLTIDDLTR